MAVRKTLIIICYMVCLAAYGAAGYTTYLACKGDISYSFGFAAFLPIWIISYWFSTFFLQLSVKTQGNKRIWVISKKLRNILNGFSNVLSIGLLLFWTVLFISLYVFKIDIFK